MIKLTVAEQRLIVTTLTKAEVDIKRVTIEGVLKGWSKKQMETSTRRIIESSIKQFPKNFPNLNDIRMGLYYSRRLWRDQFEQSLLPIFLTTLRAMVNAEPNSRIAVKYYSKGAQAITPYELFKEIDAYGPKYSQRGYISIPNYPSEIRKRVKETMEKPLGELPSTGKRRMSLTTKAEINLRYEKQIERVQEKIDDGKLLQWLSTHADCSQRCQPWQGKLVHMTLPPINDKMETGEVLDGYTVYSFKGITERVDKWGWYNNIIVGFNCRHDLYDYTPKSRPPHFYEDGQIAKERVVNEKMRRMERNIRNMRKEALGLMLLDKKEARQLRNKANQLYKEYDEYARSNDFAVHKYRTQINFTI